MIAVALATALLTVPAHAAPPTPTSVDPSSGSQGASGLELRVLGTDFEASDQVSFTPSTGITKTNTEFVDDQEIKVTVEIAQDADPTARDVTVTHTNQESGVCQGCFTVEEAEITVSPGSRGQGATGQDITITGEGFADGDDVQFSPGTGITVNEVTFVSVTEITVNIDVGDEADTISHEVSVTRLEAEPKSCANCFAVTAKPEITEVDPETAEQGSSAELTITGTGFQTDVAVAFSGDGITVDETTRDSDTQLTVGITIAEDAAADARDITATNANAGTSTCGECFTVTEAAEQVPGRFQALSPARILDTRDGTGGRDTKVGPEETIDVQVAGEGGVPADGATAVALNVTAAGPTVSGYLTIFPKGATRPHASNLNFLPDQTVPNLVVVGLGTDGKVSVFNPFGSVDVIFDVAGWYAESNGNVIESLLDNENEGRYVPVPPSRILDTRTGNAEKVGEGQTIDVQITGQGGVPEDGVAAVALNATVTQPTAASHLTIFPAGETRGGISNLNFVAGQTVPNRVMVKVGEGGKISVFNQSGSVHVVLDVNGWFTDEDTEADGGTLTPLVPARILDTRLGTGGISDKVTASQTVEVQIAGQGGVPSEDVSAVVLNVTVTQPTEPSYLTIFPSDVQEIPIASDLNFLAAQTVPNLVKVKVGEDGKVKVFNPFGTVHVIFDVVAWYS